jgi:manganese transport protein
MMTFLPIIKKRLRQNSARIHGIEPQLINLTVKPVSIVAIALDFSAGDNKLIAHAIAQGHSNATYILIHIIESATAKYLGIDVDDDETRRDKERLNNYCNELKEFGYTAKSLVGYRNRVNQIVQLVKDSNADLLIMGAHRHSGLKDYLFGETIDAVRHNLDIPVLIVNV